jgi:hypothetical protein
MATTICARIYARVEVSFAKFFLSSSFVKLLEVNFSYFAKIRWMSSCFTKLLELLALETLLALSGRQGSRCFVLAKIFHIR